MEKGKMTFRLSDDAIAALKEISEAQNCPQTKVIENLILGYRADYNPTAQAISEGIKEYINEEFKKSIDRFTLRTRGLDINVQIILEFLNSLCVSLKVPYHPYDTRPSEIYKASRVHLKKKIENQKQKKDWQEVNHD